MGRIFDYVKKKKKKKKKRRPTENNAVTLLIALFFFSFIFIYFFSLIVFLTFSNNRHENQNRQKKRNKRTNEKVFFFKKNEAKQIKKKAKKENNKIKSLITTCDHTLCTEDYRGSQTSPANIDKTLRRSYDTRDALITVGGGGRGVGMARGRGCRALGRRKEGGGVTGGGLIGLGAKKNTFAYLHISIQYIKYSLVFFSFLNPKNTVFFLFFTFFFKFPGLVKNLTA